MRIVKYSDPGHGWYKVPRSLLIKLGIADNITGYSYQYGDNVYLEEDQDMTTFLMAYFNGNIPAKWWELVKLVDNYTNRESKIRTYRPYSPKIAPKLVEGLRFNLYGNNYTAEKLGANGKWVVVNDLGARFALKRSQEQDILPTGGAES